MWEIPDILWCLGQVEEHRAGLDPYVGQALEVCPSGGFHPSEGQYVVDPDYMEPLGLEGPEELLRFHK